MGPIGWAALAVMTAQPPFYLDRDEPPEERLVRLEPAARAQEKACLKFWPQDPWACVAGTITIGQRESHWAKYVGEGRCKEGPVGMRCDPDKDGNPRAHSFWQLWPSACPGLAKLTPGSVAQLDRAASCAAAQLATAYHRCHWSQHGRWAGAFAGYRSSDCNWSGGPRRARVMVQVENRLRVIGTDKIKLALIQSND